MRSGRRRGRRFGLADDGTAYGETDTDSGAKSVVTVNVSSGNPKALPGSTLLPAGTTKGGALFTLKENGAGLLVAVRRDA
ncbi:hypothetical protein [Streptomyces sp. NPDC001530]|uniref:hypothetical protein n=1 Tax=Streptomyces sp. NPDC001530 TaxID=3364582 RepID=UPI0036B31B10